MLGVSYNDEVWSVDIFQRRFVSPCEIIISSYNTRISLHPQHFQVSILIIFSGRIWRGYQGLYSLSRRTSNFRVIRTLWHPISWLFQSDTNIMASNLVASRLRDGKTSVHLVNMPRCLPAGIFFTPWISKSQPNVECACDMPILILTLKPYE